MTQMARSEHQVLHLYGRVSLTWLHQRSHLLCALGASNSGSASE
eukprot:CAMPEP_0184378832 /NCGR_PEP_ID=MMETSP0007-20130409/3378_1 /TAXON_ID=97485 /ORGANISM="Prymnesium parvum, Strain Texoma1" /LENGTH=43 /DNA_ID= /DNA_START= /DNA_END= /DNA_ORIENTATION=